MWNGFVTKLSDVKINYISYTNLSLHNNTLFLDIGIDYDNITQDYSFIEEPKIILNNLIILIEPEIKKENAEQLISFDLPRSLIIKNGLELSDSKYCKSCAIPLKNLLNKLKLENEDTINIKFKPTIEIYIAKRKIEQSINSFFKVRCIKKQ